MHGNLTRNFNQHTRIPFKSVFTKSHFIAKPQESEDRQMDHSEIPQVKVVTVSCLFTTFDLWMDEAPNWHVLGIGRGCETPARNSCHQIDLLRTIILGGHSFNFPGCPDVKLAPWTSPDLRIPDLRILIPKLQKKTAKSRPRCCIKTKSTTPKRKSTAGTWKYPPCLWFWGFIFQGAYLLHLYT